MPRKSPSRTQAPAQQARRRALFANLLEASDEAWQQLRRERALRAQAQGRPEDAVRHIEELRGSRIARLRSRVAAK